MPRIISDLVVRWKNPSTAKTVPKMALLLAFAWNPALQAFHSAGVLGRVIVSSGEEFTAVRKSSMQTYAADFAMPKNYGCR